LVTVNRKGQGKEFYDEKVLKKDKYLVKYDDVDQE